MTNKLPELLPCPFCGSQARLAKIGNGGECAYCANEDCNVQPELKGYLDPVDAIAAWNARTTPPADALPNDLDGTEYEWKLAVPEEDAVKRPLQEAIDYKWHHVLNANGGYKFEEFSKETWGALPIGVIETLRIAAIRYRALQSPAPVTDAQREALRIAAENLDDALRVVLPLAKGYVAAHPGIESTQRWLFLADDARQQYADAIAMSAALTSPAQAQGDVEKLKREVCEAVYTGAESPEDTQDIAFRVIDHITAHYHLTPKTQEAEG